MPRKEKQLTFQDIENYLTQVGEKLTLAGVQEDIELEIFGGAFMLSQGYRETTTDVDVWPRNIPASSDDDAPNNELTIKLMAAVNRVASENKLSRHWLNDDTALFLREFLKPDKEFYKRFGPLVVYRPSPECILATKLMVYRAKDEEDVKALMRDLDITTKEQAQIIIDRFVSNKFMQLRYEIPRTLKLLFS